MISNSNCPLCNSEKISFFLKCPDNLLSREEFELWKCNACGFIFTKEYPDEKDIGIYYESDNYISHDDSAKGFLNKLYITVRNVMLGKKKRTIEKASGLKAGKILDIGCGTGYFAARMKKSGWDVTGIEPNIKAREFASGRFGLKVVSPDAISELPDKSFDVITMWHVLEHFHDPFSYAKEIIRMLKPGGICVAALPNAGSTDAAFYGEHWAAYDVPRHLWHFTPDTFRVYAEKSGLLIKYIKALPLDVFYISILSEKNRGSAIPFVAGILKGFLFSLKALPDKHKSSSLIYIMRRK